MIKNRFAILTLALFFSTPGHAEQKFQSHEAIYALVKDTIARNINASEYEISIVPLDSLLKLPECTEALEAHTTTDLRMAGRTSVGVRCNAKDKWSIFVSAAVKVYANVLVLSRPVQRGEIITRQHITSEKREISKLRGHFATQFEQVENKQATRYLLAGTVLVVGSFTEPRLVQRGEKIIISAEQPGLAIRMNGVAMTDGVKGQRIRVKNENSGRVISATVIEPGLVSVR